MRERVKNWARLVKRDLLALWLAACDKRTPLRAKIMAFLVVSYAFSPVDLIPDFIPVLGYLDDLVLVPLGILIAVSLVPQALLTEFRHQASTLKTKPQSWAGAAGVLSIWVLGLAGAAYVFIWR